MRLFLIFRALFTAKPTTILTITSTSATLAPVTTYTPYATLTPRPSLLNQTNDITAPFQLRTFIDTHLPISLKKPFNIVVILPKEKPETTLRLASQIAAVLLQLHLPAYVITQDQSPSIKPEEKRCVFFNKPTGYAPRWKLLGFSLLCLTVISSIIWYTQKQKAHEELPIKITTVKTQKSPLASPRSKKAISTPIHQPIITALHAASTRCCLIRLTSSHNKTEAHFYSQNPESLTKAQRLFSAVSHTTWSMNAPYYRAGFPPLYYGKIRQTTRQNGDNHAT